MAITRISQSSVKEGLEKFTSFYGGASGLLFGNYESIATVTAGVSGVNTVTFSNIPQDYQHLQIRAVTRANSSGYYALMGATFNNDIGSNYSVHFLRGNGSAAEAAGYASQTSAYTYGSTAATAPANTFGAATLDILNYSSTTRNKIVRWSSGHDNNGNGPGVYDQGFYNIYSGMWQNTSAITEIDIFIGTTPVFVQHSTFALYGIKS